MNILHAITLAALLHHAPAAPAVTCHTGTVSYKFVGAPGATFTYAGAKYSVPASGWIELIDSGKVYLAANGRTLPLDVWPIDAFGTRTVPVQQTETATDNSTPSTINN
ncbi:MAG: hypothetical protein QOF63_1328 [Thermoanaerobaculia bacterium]|jgi:hypothetical protein|nr:hypothetical protein [Thermoanaerobaculia bacterium]MEA2417537.1 hypothetical protein [Thermoanaerobaculia bacterium]